MKTHTHRLLHCATRDLSFISHNPQSFSFIWCLFGDSPPFLTSKELCPLNYKADLSYTWQFEAQLQIHVNHKFLFAKYRFYHKTCSSCIHSGTVLGLRDAAPRQNSVLKRGNLSNTPNAKEWTRWCFSYIESCALDRRQSSGPLFLVYVLLETNRGVSKLYFGCTELFSTCTWCDIRFVSLLKVQWLPSQNSELLLWATALRLGFRFVSLSNYWRS
jgi:hypothetical protein